MPKTTLSEICEQHDLLSVSITRMRNPETNNAWFNCNVQWADSSQQHGRAIAGGKSYTSESEALRNALAEMATIRTPDLEMAA